MDWDRDSGRAKKLYFTQKMIEKNHILWKSKVWIEKQVIFTAWGIVPLFSRLRDWEIALIVLELYLLKNQFINQISNFHIRRDILTISSVED